MLQPEPSRTSELILIGDPRIAAMPVQESGEPLVDLLNDPRLHVDVSRLYVNDQSPNISKVRSGLVKRLLTAQGLLPPGIDLLIREGHRPVFVQRQLFEHYKDVVRSHHPELLQADLERETSKFVAPPGIAPHSTGGAVDLTLKDRASGRELDMGSPFNGDPILTMGATFTAALNISEAARVNRNALCHAMKSAGFVNYPCEWWHWSFGDRYWAYLTKQAFAIYGSIDSVPGGRINIPGS